MSQKRMAIISYHTCPLSDEGTEVGGMNIYVLELSKVLAKRGFVIDIYTRLQSTESPKVVQVTENLRVIHLKAGVPKYLPPKKLTSQIPEFLNSFYSFVESENLTYDLLNCHYYLSGIAGLNIKKKFKIPMLMTFHTLALMKNLVARTNDERESLQRIKSELQLVKKSDKVIATSRSDAEYLNTLYNCKKEKIIVLTPGINFDLFRPIEKIKAKKEVGASLSDKLILFVGRIQPLKGIDVLLYATKIMLKKNPYMKLCLWIVGGDIEGSIENWPKELRKLEQLRKLLKISAIVNFVGRKEQNELPYYYSAAEIVVMPSQYEAFGMTALEAMSCGTPVITTDVTGVSRIFEKNHTNLVTSANNPLLLAKKIQRFLTNEEEYKKVREDVMGQVKNLNWENVAEKFVSVCKFYK